MKKSSSIYRVSIALLVVFVLVNVWSGFTRPLGSEFNPDETRTNAIVSSLIFTGIVSLTVFGLLVALRKNRLYAVISWVVLAPALLMLSWDTLTKNLVERGVIGISWLTDSAYQEAQLHRSIWILAGLIVGGVFLYNLYKQLSITQAKKR